MKRWQGEPRSIDVEFTQELKLKKYAHVKCVAAINSDITLMRLVPSLFFIQHPIKTSCRIRRDNTQHSLNIGSRLCNCVYPRSAGGAGQLNPSKVSFLKAHSLQCFSCLPTSSHLI